MDREKLNRLTYTVVGFAAHHLDEMRAKLPPAAEQTTHRQGPHIIFIFWDAPSYRKSKELMEELQGKFTGNGLPIGVGLSVRPWANVLDASHSYDYDSSHNQGFTVAAIETKTPVFFITAGMQWNEVAYPPSPLLHMLERTGENLMRYQDGTRVEKVLQPPANYLPRLLRGMFGTDRNGVLYLSHDAPAVSYYREKNLMQMAKSIADFANLHPELYLGASVENEVDFPGKWITGGRELMVDSQEKRIEEVRQVLRQNVKVFQQAGVTNIYTNQSIADAENRGSPLLTALIEGANVGITTWRTGNTRIYHEAAELASSNGVDWSVLITNPLSLKLTDNTTELQGILDCKPKIIGVYNWWPHFPGYGIRGLPFEQALRGLTR